MPLNVQVERYRREAERCRLKAREARDPVIRETWAALSEEYDGLARSAAGLNWFKGSIDRADAAY